MSVLDKLVMNNSKTKPLTGKSVLVCAHAAASTAKLIRAITMLGASVAYVPVSYNGVSMIGNIDDVSDVKMVKTTSGAVHSELPSTDVILEDGMRTIGAGKMRGPRKGWKRCDPKWEDTGTRHPFPLQTSISTPLD